MTVLKVVNVSTVIGRHASSILRCYFVVLRLQREINYKGAVCVKYDYCLEVQPIADGYPRILSFLSRTVSLNRQKSVEVIDG